MRRVELVETVLCDLCAAVEKGKEEPALHPYVVGVDPGKRPRSAPRAIDVCDEHKPLMDLLFTVTRSARSVPLNEQVEEERAPRGRLRDRAPVQHGVRKVEREFLVGLLSERGPCLWSTVMAAGRAKGFTLASLRRARGDVPLVKVFMPGRGNAGTRWGLPGMENGGPPPEPQVELDGARKSITCDLCGKTMLAKSVYAHLERTHGAVSRRQPKKCPECGKVFRDRAMLSHRYRAHGHLSWREMMDSVRRA